MMSGCSFACCFVSLVLSLLLLVVLFANASPEAKQLYEDLMHDYNKLVRPIQNSTEPVVVKFKLKLIELRGVHEKEQIMETNVQLVHEWFDSKLSWNPDLYGGITHMYVPSTYIWIPDTVLYNNADGNYQITIMTKAIVRHTGYVLWKPPALYKSMCDIDVLWFPYDQQKCKMKFGTWSYSRIEVDLQHSFPSNLIVNSTENDEVGVPQQVQTVQIGMDLSEYQTSDQWSIMAVPAVRHIKDYPQTGESYVDITYQVLLMRKPLFYTTNLVVPSLGISLLAFLVFYLPVDSGEKMTLCISILISLTVFQLLLVEIMPSTSLVIPLIGKYLLFTMIIVSVSVLITVLTCNFHFRSPATHLLSPTLRHIFVEVLPRFLLMQPKMTRRGMPLKKNTETQETFVTRLSPSASGYSLAQSQPALPRMMTHSVSMTAPTTPSDPFNQPWLLDETSFQASRSRNSDFPWIRRLEAAGDGGTAIHKRSSFRENSSIGATEHQHNTAVVPFWIPQLDKAMGIQKRVSLRGAASLTQLMADIRYIGQHFKQKFEDQDIEDEWRYIAMVIDRFFLIVFTLFTFAGTIICFVLSPTLYETAVPIA